MGPCICLSTRIEDVTFWLLLLILALLTGYAASLHLEEIDIFGQRHLVDPCSFNRTFRPHRHVDLLAPVLTPTGTHFHFTS